LDAANPHAKLTIEEDTGHSIARHIWDAGLVLSARLHEICSSSTTQVSRAADGLRLLYERLRRDGHKPLKVLELGTGCGLVAATLAHSINSSKVECITATDLPDAEAIATANLTLAGSDKLGYANLDWSEPLPNNVSSTTYDLVFVADCTYNSDVVPYLVKTLAKLVTGKDTLICLAMKVRHDSEAIFFDLMEEKHLKIVGKHTDILKDLNGPDQNIHTYLFQHEGAVRG
jgi:predicted O-methyltransferase YrrM